jgi:methyl-accepting chemotaxis protein
VPPTKSSSKKRLSLSIRISLWLMGVAILPLLLALLITEMQARPALVNQANTSMENNTKTQANLIDSYVSNKLQIIGSLDNIPLVQQYLQDPTDDDPENINGPTGIVQNGIFLEKYLYPDISGAEFFTLKGKLLLSFTTQNPKTQLQAAHPVPAEYLKKVLLGKPFASGVYYDAKTGKSSIDLYSPVYTPSFKGILGFVIHRLNLDTVWSFVDGAKGANGSGSYAFLLDQNGVRIVDPDPNDLFTAIAPLNQQAQQQIQAQQLYGLNTRQVPVVADKTLQSTQSQSKPPVSFQEIPADQHDAFQVTRQQLTTVPWTYFMLTPVNVVETVANQQLLTLSLIALLVLVAVAIIGWIVGRRISSPVQRSVDALKRNSSALNELADKEEMAASEQVWVIEASKAGLKSVEYFTNASESAIQRLNDLGQALPRHRYTDIQAYLRDVDLLVYTAKYLEKAVNYQDTSNVKVSTAISVTEEVVRQLASGASSTKEVADEVDHVVQQLRQAVGGRDR